MDSGRDDSQVAAGFPHSGIAGSLDACSSPTLFAAYHALLRLSVPRHPPCALVRLTGKFLSQTHTPSRCSLLLPEKERRHSPPRKDPHASPSARIPTPEREIAASPSLLLPRLSMNIG